MSVETHDYAGELIVPSNPTLGDTSDEVATGSNKRREDQAEIQHGRESVIKRFRKSSVEKDALGAGRGKRRLAGKLSFLPNMALDILYDIFSHLTPGDLVNVSRVSKAFREVLLVKSSMSVWKTSFNNVPGLPPCPEDVCPPSWANLVFGGVTCHSCGEKHVRKVDFRLRRRVCPDCQKKHLLTESLFRQFVPSVPDDLLNCIPNVLRYFRGSRGLRRAWWDDDVAALEGEVQRLYRSVEPTDLEAALEVFKRNKEALMQRMEAAAAAWYTWVQTNTDERSRIREGKKEIRRTEVLNRCLALGYEKADCRKILKHKSVNNESQFSERAWEKTLSTIHPILEERKASRLISERTRRKKARLQVIREEYVGLLKIMLPGPDEEVTPEFRPSVQHVLDSLQPELWTLSTQRLNAVVSLVPTFSDQPKCASLSQRRTPIQLGLTALGHICPDSVRYPEGEFSGTCLPTFSPKGREIVVMILRDLALDETHTTIADLDQLDHRFVCLSCPVEWGNVHRRRKRDKSGRYALTWRSLVSHLLHVQTAPSQVESEPHDSHPRFKILSSSEATIVQQCEQDILQNLRLRSWGCCHCNISLCGPSAPNWMTSQEIKEHLKDTHKINQPLPHRDYFNDPSHCYPDAAVHIAMSL
ncbi:uncharacterized protein STEHIDRAFT_151287 [Stereum hirsutum FP-91666 SS1]|uniref:uncharacterized protein n=1 Tax=Stereum hirsutum (strain FP-91666) TaxID=721885 RepID=UPI0004410485|nr:uncharacterized protein STEHIDRAFT_151287 [Stereum hirsutum FP-91666 SS1]EIM91932.1 hypothetical protein STEHIDRAFT_151287 [Stereum hirsutum FP-91666 SS1]